MLGAMSAEVLSASGRVPRGIPGVCGRRCQADFYARWAIPLGAAVPNGTAKSFVALVEEFFAIRHLRRTRWADAAGEFRIGDQAKCVPV